MKKRRLTCQMRCAKRGSTVSGILNIDKPVGKTSHDVVDTVRRISGAKRVGHAGTLDPMASGVLLVCIGQATRVVEYLMEARKVYSAEIVLGIATDTYDAQGRITHSSPETPVTLDQIKGALAAFMGRIEQVPPMYSAIKRQGTPLYTLARQGMTVKREPRQVEIYDIKLINWSSPMLQIEVECSKGTYIRSLAHDLGEKLGCGAHLRSLVRLASGRFTLDEAVSLSALEEAFGQGYWPELIYPLDEALLDYEAMIVNEEKAKRIRWGQQIEGEGKISTHLCRAYSVEGELIALLQYDQRTGLWQPKKVFNLCGSSLTWKS